MYKNLANMDMSEEDKGFYLINCTKVSDKIKTIISEVGNAGVYRYYEYKYGADSNKNNKLTKDEITAYLNNQSMNRGERAYWFDVMKPNSEE